MCRLLLLWSRGSGAHGLSRSAAGGIFLDQGSNPCLLHWQVDSLPLSPQGRPTFGLFADHAQAGTPLFSVSYSFFEFCCPRRCLSRSKHLSPWPQAPACVSPVPRMEAFPQASSCWRPLITLRGCDGQTSRAPPGPSPERSHLYRQKTSQLQSALARTLSQPAPSHPGAISEEGTSWPNQPTFQGISAGSEFPGPRPNPSGSCHVPSRSQPTTPGSPENTPLKSWRVLNTEP